jgi:F-type H+-transporting ATPase subunit b
MQIVETVALITINATLFVQLGSFLLFVVIFNRILIRPLRKTMAERSSLLEKIAQDITAADLTYEEISKQIRTQEKQARSDAFIIQTAIEDEGLHSAEEIIAKTRQEITRIRVDAQRKTEAHLSAARQQIASEAEPIADRMIAALLGRRSAS